MRKQNAMSAEEIEAFKDGIRKNLEDTRATNPAAKRRTRRKKITVGQLELFELDTITDVSADFDWLNVTCSQLCEDREHKLFHGRYKQRLFTPNVKITAVPVRASSQTWKIRADVYREQWANPSKAA